MFCFLVVLGIGKTTQAAELTTSMSLRAESSAAGSQSLFDRDSWSASTNHLAEALRAPEHPTPRSVGMCGPSAQSIDAPTPLVAAVTPALTDCRTAGFKNLSKTLELPEPAEIEKENLQPSVGVPLPTAQTIAASQVSSKLQRQALGWLTRQDLRRLLRPPIA